MNHFTHIAISLFIVLALGSCSKSNQEPTRVLIVYIGADNNLSGLEQEKIEGLRDGWSEKPTDKIIAYVDNQSSGGILYDLSVPNSSTPSILASYGKENSASPEVLNRVINNVIRTYPADSYGLLVFSHASGWLPSGGLGNPTRSLMPPTSRSVITNEGLEMELADFSAAIPSDVFDYIAFETCFMAGIEVAYELKDKAPCILASSAEIIHPGFAPVYPVSTGKLFSGDLAGFGKDVFDHTLTYAEDNLQRSATYSVIHTAGLDALAAFIHDNCDFSRTIDISQIQHFDRNSYHLFFDFEDYYSSLLSTDKQREELAQLISDCIHWKVCTTEFMTQKNGYNGFRIHKHSGLTVYIPQMQFPKLNEAYSTLEWNRAINM